MELLFSEIGQLENGKHLFIRESRLSEEARMTAGPNFAGTDVKSSQPFLLDVQDKDCELRLNINDTHF